MISLDEARRIISQNIFPLSPEEITIENSLGTILAEDIRADADYPSADRSMMDGYVVREDASPGTFKITGEIPAAGLSQVKLEEGDAMRIFTGATLPSSGARVIMQEQCTRDGDRVHIPSFPESLFVRPKASEARTGDIVLRKGTRIGATEMAILAQVGCVNPRAIRKATIKHIATGDELVPPAEQPTPGKIRDTNSSLIAGLLAPFHILLESVRVADHTEKITIAIEGDWDILLISGGASVGDHDHGAAVLRAAGFTIHFDTVNLRPGKPLTFATRGAQIAFVIPGNPVSHFACFHVAIRLAIELLSAATPHWDFLDLEIINPHLLKPNPRETFWPARVSSQGGKLISQPLHWSTSGDTFSLTECNALIRVDPSGKHLTLLLDLPHPSA